MESAPFASRRLAPLALAALLAGCAGLRPSAPMPAEGTARPAPAAVALPTHRLPEAVPGVEPLPPGRLEIPELPDLPVPPESTAPAETGIASWYGRPFHGRRTANGERFDMHAMTAAHKTLPFGSLVLVRNPANERQVVVRINDRGPFRRGRIIDLSQAAARALGIAGLAPVELRPATAAPDLAER